MNENTVSMLKHWIEPAHPGIVRLHDDLLEIYKFIRQKQERFDDIFDGLAKDIGFVVTTSVAVTLEMKNNAIQKAEMGAEHLRQTMFKRVLEPLKGGTVEKVADGTYNIYVIWFGALRLKLRADWMEPAHFRTEWMEPAHFSDRLINVIQQQLFGKTRPDIREPAHWFDPGIAISEIDVVQIAALDFVYPELYLAKHIGAYRDRLRAAIAPGVREPAHFPAHSHGDLSHILQHLRAEQSWR